MTKHRGFFLSIDNEPAHFLADPNMSPETQHALEELVRAVRKQIDAIPTQPCSRCGKPTRVGGDICTKCKVAELWEGEGC